MKSIDGKLFLTGYLWTNHMDEFNKKYCQTQRIDLDSGFLENLQLGEHTRALPTVSLNPTKLNENYKLTLEQAKLITEKAKKYQTTCTKFNPPSKVNLPTKLSYELQDWDRIEKIFKHLVTNIKKKPKKEPSMIMNATFIDGNNEDIFCEISFLIDKNQKSEETVVIKPPIETLKYIANELSQETGETEVLKEAVYHYILAFDLHICGQSFLLKRDKGEEFVVPYNPYLMECLNGPMETAVVLDEVIAEEKSQESHFKELNVIESWFCMVSSSKIQWSSEQIVKIPIFPFHKRRFVSYEEEDKKYEEIDMFKYKDWELKEGAQTWFYRYKCRPVSVRHMAFAQMAISYAPGNSKERQDDIQKLSKSNGIERGNDTMEIVGAVSTDPLERYLPTKMFIPTNQVLYLKNKQSILPILPSSVNRQLLMLFFYPWTQEGDIRENMEDEERIKRAFNNLKILFPSNCYFDST